MVRSSGLKVLGVGDHCIERKVPTMVFITLPSGISFMKTHVTHSGLFMDARQYH